MNGIASASPQGPVEGDSSGPDGPDGARFGDSPAVLMLACVVSLGVAAWGGWRCRASLEGRERQALAAEMASFVAGATAGVRVTLAGDGAPAPGSLVAYRAVDALGGTLGYVMPFAGPGFQNEIHGVLAVDPGVERILRLSVTRSAESPDGDLLGRSAGMLRQFRGLDCRNPVRLTAASDEGVHAIAGASVSSQILVRLTNDCLRRLRAHVAAGAKKTGTH